MLGVLLIRRAVYIEAEDLGFEMENLDDGRMSMDEARGGDAIKQVKTDEEVGLVKGVILIVKS